MKKMILLIFLIMQPVLIFAFDGDSWVVTGDRVILRSRPSAKSAGIMELNSGRLVQVVNKTKERDKFLPGDNFGFFWYEAVLKNGKKGWIYGKFLYQMNGDRFAAEGSASVFYNPYKIGGKSYLFGIAVEDAYPVSDDKGLSGSIIHAIPFFAEEGGDTALFFKTEKIHTYMDEDLKFPYFFRLTDSDYGMQQVISVKIDEKNKTGSVRLDIDFNTQTGGGKFYILAKFTRGNLIITEYKILKETK